MKKTAVWTRFFVLLCAVSCLFPLATAALAPSSYTGESHASHRFTDALPSYTAGASFDGFRGNYTVGSFPIANPENYAPFAAISRQYNILCQEARGNDGSQWTSGGMYLASRARCMITVPGSATAIAYTAPRAGTVTLSMEELRAWAENANNVIAIDFAIFLNGEMIFPQSGNWQTYTSPDKTASYAPGFSAIPNITMDAGDRLLFAYKRADANATPYAYLSPVVTYTAYAGETYRMAKSLCGIQGSGGFYAGYSAAGNHAVYALPAFSEEDGAFGGKAGAGTVSSASLTIGASYDTVLLFRSPIIATYTLSATLCRASAPTELRARLRRADGTTSDIFTRTVTESGSFTPQGGIAMDVGDVLELRFHGTEGTTVAFSPVMQSTATVHATTQNSEALVDLAGSFALSPDARLYAVGTSLAGDIRLRLYTYFDPALIAGADEYGVLVFPEEETETVYRAEYALTEGEANGENRYIFTYPGIAAKNMQSTLRMRAYIKTGDTILYGEVCEGGVQHYAEGLLRLYRGSSTPRGEALYRLACTMLNYGAEAQEYFLYRITQLANAALTEEEKAMPTMIYENHFAASGTATLTDIRLAGAALVLGNLPSFVLYAQADTGKGTSDVRLEVATDPAFREGSLRGSYPLVMQGGGHCRVFLDGVAPADMRTVFYFRLREGDAVSRTLAYSAETYAARILSQDSDEARAALPVIHRLFAYADAVIAYAAVSGQEQNGTPIAAEELVNAIRTGSVTPGAIYTVTDHNPLLFDSTDIGRNYDAKGITIYAKNSIRLANVSRMTLSHLTFNLLESEVPALMTEGGADLSFEAVTINSSGTSAVAVSGTENVYFRSVDIAGGVQNGIVLSAGTGGAYLIDSTLSVLSLAVRDLSEDGIYAKGNTIVSGAYGFYLHGTGAEIRGNTITAATAAVAVAGGSDILIARNNFSSPVILTDGDNVVVFENTVTALTAKNNRHLYVVGNTVGGTLTLQQNAYVLADANTSATLTDTENTYKSGDTLTHVNHRAEVGADESLLPQVDKDQFVGKARRTAVRTANGTSPALPAYITASLAADADVILAPGAYSVISTLTFSGMRNKAVYGYGVMVERAVRLDNLISIGNCQGVTLYGLTIGYAQQSCGQVYVLEKQQNNTLLVITGAGMMNEFGNTDPNYYDTTGMGAQHAGTYYAYVDAGFESITKNADGTMSIRVSSTYYNMIEKGDVLTCRASNGGTTVYVGGSEGVSFCDMTVYGAAAGFAFVEQNNRSATSYYRVLDTTKNGALIDAGTYNSYRAWESAYGVDLEVSIDAQGRHRGSPAHIGSIDATHTTKCKEGSRVTSCLFENMCDDGTNQNAVHGRVHAITDNGDGTATITYKGNLSEYSYRNNKNWAPNGLCSPFIIGDRVYIYTAKGQLVCDTAALSATVQGVTETVTITESGADYQKSLTYYTVTVAASAVNFNALSGYDMTDNRWEPDHKVLIDNMSMSSNGFLFDNTLVRNIRSRGLLIKASDATIKNCSLINIGMGAVAIHYEIFWGESGVTENLTVKDNLIQHTGYFNNRDIYSPISILGLGSRPEQDYLLYQNIHITGNRILNRTTDYAVYINSAKNITVENNVFGPRYGLTNDEDDSPAIHIFCADDVTISGNTYPTQLTDDYSRFLLRNAYNVHGTDVESNANVTVFTSFGSNTPTISGTGVTYRGGWELGYMNATDFGSFVPYNGYNEQNRWICKDGDIANLWGRQGGFFVSMSYRFASQANHLAVMRYTAEESGTYDITPANFSAPNIGGGNNAGYFAIFQGDRMIWPSRNGSFADKTTWRLITPTTTQREIALSLRNDLGTIELTKGEALSFVSAQYEGKWSAILLQPELRRYHTETPNTAVFSPQTDAWPTFTTNGAFGAFRGGFTVGCLGTDGSHYTPYGYMDATYHLLFRTGDAHAWTAGGLYLTQGKLALVTNYATAVCYTAPKNGVVDVQLAELFVGSDRAGKRGLCLTIYKNGTQIWPANGNAFTYETGETYTAGGRTDILSAAWSACPFPTGISVTAGDTICFAVRRNTAIDYGEMAFITPVISYR